MPKIALPRAIGDGRIWEGISLMNACSISVPSS